MVLIAEQWSEIVLPNRGKILRSLFLFQRMEINSNEREGLWGGMDQ